MSENIIILLSFIAIIVGATLLFQKIINSIRSKPLLKSKALLSLEVDGLQKKIEQLTNQHDALDAETKDLQQLRDNGEQLARDVDLPYLVSVLVILQGQKGPPAGALADHAAHLVILIGVPHPGGNGALE